MKHSADTICFSRVYYTGFFLLLLAGIVLLSLYGNSAVFIPLNSHHPFWLNVFFINCTFMGDGIFAICLPAAYLFYFKQRKKGLALLIAFLCSSLLVQLAKNLINPGKPKLFFEMGQYLQLNDGNPVSSYAGFPSGHTATAFAIATVLVFFTNSGIRQVLVLVMTAMVGFSRIYLAQHFIEDVIMGSLIGVTGGITGYLMMRWISSKRNLAKQQLSFGEKQGWLLS